MPTSPLTPQQLQQLSKTIEQTMTQLQIMETSTEVPPMQHDAHLCWEQLNEVRELLRDYLPPQPHGIAVDFYDLR